MTYTASSHNKMGASRQPPRKSLRRPKCCLLLGEQRVTANKPKFIPSQRILGGSNKHFQKGKWPPFLGTVGLLHCTPLPELPTLHFREPWRAKMSPDALQVALPISTHRPPLPTSLVGFCSPDCYPAWLANVQAVTVVKYFECHPWHLPKFSCEVSDPQDCL